jgi:hypothetical protein
MIVLLACGSLLAQQPQSTDPLVANNVRYVQGVGPGYAPTAGTGLTLNVAAGTAFCNGAIVTYAGGTLTMAASVTNQVYLSTSSSCVPAVKSSGFTAADIPIATVVAGSSTITSIQDDRTMQSQGSGTTVGDSDVLGQTASQSTVNLVGTVPTSGKYRVSYYATQHAVCASGSVSVSFTFTWVDSNATRTAQSVGLTMGSSQSASQGAIEGVIPIYAVASSSVTYTSTVTGSCASGGPASYDAHISVEAIQ